LSKQEISHENITGTASGKYKPGLRRHHILSPQMWNCGAEATHFVVYTQKRIHRYIEKILPLVNVATHGEA
jgi:hypothetical protein